MRSFRSVGASWAGNARFHPAAMLLMAAVVMASAASQATFGDDRAEPSAGLRYYDQGGVVVDGVAYFTSSDRPNGFPHVAAFRLPEMERIRTYAFAETYDSTPFVFQKRDGAWLVIAHEYKQARTVAISRDTGAVEWISPANQPGSYFFGYSCFDKQDGSKILLMSCRNGLHALDGETGRELWWVKHRNTGGVTPCVDQKRGWIFCQGNSRMFKIRAGDGEVLQSRAVDAPNVCISWNTVLVNDQHGYFVVTRWYGKPEWDSAIRVYDENLSIVWEKTRLPIGKKTTLTYAEGKVVFGGGNSWSKSYQGDQWKYVAAYAVGNGILEWKLDASQFRFSSIMNIPYYHGYFYAETQNGPDASQILRIRATDGVLEEVYDFGRPITSCAQCIIGRGLLLTGDLHQHRLVGLRIANRSPVDWPGPFGDPQTNQNAAPADSEGRFTPIHEVPPAESGKVPR